MDLLVAIGVAALALLTRVGYALYAMGLVRAKNSAATVVRSIGDLCFAAMAFWAIGEAVLGSVSNRWIGINRQFLFGMHSGPDLFFYTIVILTATPAVSGAIAERCRFFPLMLSSLVLAGFVLPATCNCAWAGWLRRHGFLDVAGGAALHVAAGVFALVACAMVGPRGGKFNRDGSSSMIPGHNLPMAGVGVLLLLVGWIPYVCGMALMGMDASGLAAGNVLMATVAAGCASIIFGQIRFGKPDIVLTLMGLFGGMVSICAGAGRVPVWAAVVTGTVAGIIVPLAVGWIDLRGRIDDPLGAIAIHAVAGAWGTIAAGIFILNPLAPSRAQQIGVQVIGVIGIAIFSAAVAWALFAAFKATVGLQIREQDEFEGLDLAEHDIGAYPDFQQNSIKSYHLREA